MASHVFGSYLNCERCGLRKVKQGGVFVYSESNTNEWSEEPRECLSDDELESLVVPWRTRPIVMMDSETSGLDWTHGFLTEIGLVIFDLLPSSDGGYRASVREKYAAVLRAPEGFSQEEVERLVGETSEITGITSEMVRSGAPPKEALSKIFDLVESLGEGALGAAYNARFDQPFIASAFLRSGLRVPRILAPSQPMLDPYLWVQNFDRYVKGQGRHKLTTTAIRRKIASEAECEGAHRADFDAELAARLLASMAHEVPADLEDLRDFQQSCHGEWAQNFFGSYLPKARKQKRIAELLQRRTAGGEPIRGSAKGL